MSVPVNALLPCTAMKYGCTAGPFVSRRILQRHIAAHHSKLVPCRVEGCDDLFRTEAERVYHIDKNHGRTKRARAAEDARSEATVEVSAPAAEVAVAGMTVQEAGDRALEQAKALARSGASTMTGSELKCRVPTCDRILATSAGRASHERNTHGVRWVAGELIPAASLPAMVPDPYPKPSAPGSLVDRLTAGEPDPGGDDSEGEVPLPPVRRNIRTPKSLREEANRREVQEREADPIVMEMPMADVGIVLTPTDAKALVAALGEQPLADVYADHFYEEDLDRLRELSARLKLYLRLVDQVGR